MTPTQEEEESTSMSHVTLNDHRNHAVCMGTAIKLSPSQVCDRLNTLPGWDIREQKLYRTFAFSSFVEAIEFVKRVAVVAERLNHHPSLRVDKRNVEVAIWTRKLGCLTVHDFELAASVDSVVEAQR